MATNVLALRQCDVEIDHTCLPTEQLVAAAFRAVEDYVRGLDARFERDGVTVPAVCVRPVPTDALIAFLAGPDVFRIEVEFMPTVVR
jgi:hypothetical protein